jgi:NitT/TauT family transport system substrate-binding protein
MVGFRLIRTYALIAAAAIVAVGGDAVRAQQDTGVRLALNRGIDGLAAPFLVALDQGYYKEAGLAVTIEPDAGISESISRVASGEVQMGVADINALVRYRSGADPVDIKAVMMFHDLAPYAIIGRRSGGVRSVADLEGRSLAVTPTDLVFPLWPLVARAGEIDSNRVAMESVGVALREEMLVQGQVDAVLGTVLESVVILEEAGVPADDMSVILLSGNGLELYGDAVIVNPEFAEAEPDAVRAFVKATIRGMGDTVADPAGSIETVLWRNYDMRRSMEIARLALVIDEIIDTDWVRENGFGGVDSDRLARSIEQLGFAYGFGDAVKAGDVFTDAFLPPPAERMLR